MTTAGTAIGTVAFSFRSLLLLLFLGGLCGGNALADDAGLRIALNGEQRFFPLAELLASPAIRPIEIPNDPAYGTPMRYLAIKLADLLKGFPAGPISALEARATDGFVSQLPWTLFGAAQVSGEQGGGEQGGAVPWLAVEDPAHPWPHLEGKAFSAGPLYLVWEHPERSNVAPEQWPYALAGLTGVADPLVRWPQLAVPAGVAAADVARRGQAVFAVQCLPCHKLSGAGAGEQGPDLGRKMPATAYLTEAGLKALIRDPASVRTWPQQQMPGFDATTLPDADLDAVVVYLGAITGVAAR